MVLIFTFGVLASLASYRLEVKRLGGNLWERTLQEQARELRASMRMRSDGSVQLDLSPAWRRAYADRNGDFAYTIYDTVGHAVARSPNLGAPLPYFSVPAGRTFAPINLIGAGPDQRAVIAERSPNGYVVVARHRGRETLINSLFEEGSEQLLVLAPFVVLALGLIWVITWWSLRPISRASKEAAAVGPANPAIRLSVDGLPREIQPLVSAVNGALERLGDAYSREHRMTADAAHALRTPLAVLSLRLQRARHSGITDWPAIERDLTQMTGLVSQLLDLARKESLSRRVDADKLPVINLSRVVREAAAQIVPLSEGRNRAMEINVPETVPFRGHIDDLRDLVRNLLENALLHGSGTVRVNLRQDRDALHGGITLEVADSGTGVPLGREAEVFERFRKLHTDSPGAGLGLAVVRQVARSHGGDAHLVPGAGRVIVVLPNNAQPSAVEIRPAAE